MSPPTLACTADRDATVEAAAHKSGRHRTIVLALALGALAFAWANMAFISRTAPWYRNTDMNIHNMADALAINSSHSPNTIDQPGLPLKFLLALDFRIRHELGLLPVWNLKKFANSPDPIREIAPLIHAERVHSRILVLTLILFAAGFTYAVTRDMDAACLTVLLLCGSSGLLFHGLLIRPELLCVGLGNVLGLLCAWQATSARSWQAKYSWLFAAGMFGGLAMLEKLPGIGYLALAYAWCWLSALLKIWDKSSHPKSHLPYLNSWSSLVPIMAGVAVLWLLFQLTDYQEMLGPVVVQRLRSAAVFIGLLPLVKLWPKPNRFRLFWLDRSQELAALVAGALATLPLAYLLLRGVMTEPAASTYFARTLHFVINPGPTLNLLLYTKPNLAVEYMAFLKESPVLFIGTIAASITAFSLRVVPLPLKALIFILLAGAMSLTLLMSQRNFADQYSIFLQVPLLLALALSVAGFSAQWRQRHPTAGVHWSTPLVLAATITFAITIYARLEPKFTSYQYDASLPVNDLAITFIFDHDAHPQAYLRAMKDHYHSRANFAKILNEYLADQTNRY